MKRRDDYRLIWYVIAFFAGMMIGIFITPGRRESAALIRENEDLRASITTILRTQKEPGNE